MAQELENCFTCGCYFTKSYAAACNYHAGRGYDLEETFPLIPSWYTACDCDYCGYYDDGGDFRITIDTVCDKCARLNDNRTETLILAERKAREDYALMISEITGEKPQKLKIRIKRKTLCLKLVK